MAPFNTDLTHRARIMMEISVGGEGVWFSEPPLSNPARVCSELLHGVGSKGKSFLLSLGSFLLSLVGPFPTPLVPFNSR